MDKLSAIVSNLRWGHILVGCVFFVCEEGAFVFLSGRNSQLTEGCALIVERLGSDGSLITMVASLVTLVDERDAGTRRSPTREVM